MNYKELVKYTSIQISCLLHWPKERDMLISVGNIAGECYNSSKDDDKCCARALSCIARGHHSPWEHINLTIKATVDRGTSHALVRHRHCAFQQSSTIYQKYDGGITLIRPADESPVKGDKVYGLNYIEDEYYMNCYTLYSKLLEQGMPPARARDVLPNALATNLIITTNFREWMYIIQRRQGPGDSVNMHIFANKLEDLFNTLYPNAVEEFAKWYEKHPL